MLGGRRAGAGSDEEAPNGLSLLDYANGVIVEAGEWPSLGWVERDPQSAAYVSANRILKPVRVPELCCLHSGSIVSEVRFDKVSTDQWLRRFDAPGIWPSHRNGEGPIEAAPATVEVVEPAQASISDSAVWWSNIARISGPTHARMRATGLVRL
ncbi:type VI immunity family protein [Burkholderia ubonensis]|uniref:type VI immunity family protein n=1 Tax=Burkholderia ubonensis TaxID=101571 RepID=UPI000BA70EBD|nr:hypothetical protein CJO70_23655 [Burkholderia ubonensis]PAJ92796.1 hypothetical protein CJO69_19945 [Burkholderia ubonensis]PAK05500.1 hypothetical protein CJO67_23635 [Burkholderia ubonensis]RQP67245.1 DUF3396 domain-containing protein [Burkholderia ubonensis]RQP73317.1 DUF3396 domain-containing protein [Burkholderia ubonensis]